MAYELSRCFGLIYGPQDAGAATSSPNLSSAFVFETSGAVWCCKFTAPVGQSAATLTLYAYCTGVTGSPTFEMEVRNGYSGSGDADRPETAGSNLASVASSMAPTVSTWCSATCTVSLTAGNTYWVILKNTHATPASNHATFQYRGSLDSVSMTPGLAAWLHGMNAGYSTDGFATDPTVLTASIGTFVVKFSDGTLLGCPYVSSSAHANNTNSRGIRIQFSEDVVVSGIGVPAASSGLTGVASYTTGGSTVITAAGDAGVENKSVLYRFAPTKLTGGTAYDVVCTFSTNSTNGTYYTMGMAEGSVPADVLACRLPGMASVDGATPGSFTVDTSQVIIVGLVIDDFPAIAGGTGGVIGGPNMRGGMMA